jgi:hypothetical protein
MDWIETGIALCAAALLIFALLRRTLFPDDNQPHARCLYADLTTPWSSRTV